MKNRTRTENLSVSFVDRQAVGWAFGVGDWFRMQLDIRLDVRMDTQANLQKKNRLGRKLEPSEKITRSVWTQGSPPAYSFSRGHLFHEINESPEGIRRSIIVLLSRPDPGALIETERTDETGAELTVVTESEESADKDGFVDYEVVSYSNGNLITDEAGFVVKEQSSRSQSAFAELLKTG